MTTLLLIRAVRPLTTAVQPYPIVEHFVIFDLKVRPILFVAVGIGYYASADEGVLSLAACFEEAPSSATISKTTYWRRVSHYRNEFILGRRVRARYMENEVTFGSCAGYNIALSCQRHIFHLNIFAFLRSLGW